MHMPDTHKTSRAHGGFTLAELLIVVAIIAVLVAVAIPVFAGQLEKSREATDMANVRAAYAEVMAAALAEDHSAQHEGETIYQSDGTYKAKVALEQSQKDWQTSGTITIGGVSHEEGDGNTANWIGIPDAGGTCTITYNPASASGGVVLNWSGESTQTYKDSQEVQAAKTTSQNAATKNLTELEQAMTKWESDRSKWKSALDNLSESKAKFTLSNGVVAYYKKSSGAITTMDAEKSSDGKSWINFTLDDDGKIIFYNYVDKNYSYSTENASAETPTWKGSAVIQ